MIYIFVIVYTIIMAYVYKRNYIWRKTKRLTISKLSKIAFFMVMILPIVLVSGLRYGISVDYTKIYERGFNQITFSNSNIVGFEMGFYYLVKICGYIIDQPWFMFLVTSSIIIVLFFISIEESSNYLMSVVLLFGVGLYFDSFNGIRQYLVVAIFMYAFRYIKSGDWKKYFIIMSLSAFLHTSALFTLPIYFLSKVKVNKIYAIIAVVILNGFSKKLYQIVVSIMTIIPRYNEYIVRNTLQNQISFSLSGMLMALMALVPCLLAERKMNENAEGKFLYNMVLLGVIVASCTSFLPLAERILYYTKSYIVFAVPYACSCLPKGKNSAIIKILIPMMFSGLTMAGMLLYDWYAVLPYVSVFSK